MAEFHFLLFELAFLILGILSAIRVFKSWKETKNRVLFAIGLYISAVAFRSTFDVAIYSFDFSLDVIVAGYLTLGQIIAQFLFIIQLEFMFYLKKRPRLYTLPFVLAFYILMGRVLVDSNMPFIMYAAIVSYGSAFFLIKDGRSRRNGLAIGMGLFFLFWGLGQSIPVDTILIAFKLIGMLAFYLGTRGFYEKYVFINVQEEDRILNTWISKLVASE